MMKYYTIFVFIGLSGCFSVLTEAAEIKLEADREGRIVVQGSVINAYGDIYYGVDEKNKDKLKELPNTERRSRNYRTVPDGEGALTPEMIEQCIHLKVDMDASYSAIGKAKDMLDIAKKKLTEAGESLRLAKEEVNERNRTYYNAAVMKYNESLPVFDNVLNRYKQMVNVYNQKADKFDRECNGQPYYEDDYAAMVKKVGSGM